MQDLVPEGPIEGLQEKNLIKFFSCWKIKKPIEIEPAKVLMILKLHFSFFRNMLSLWTSAWFLRISFRNWNFFPANIQLHRGAFFLCVTNQSECVSKLFVQEKITGMLNKTSLCKTWLSWDSFGQDIGRENC